MLRSILSLSVALAAVANAGSARAQHHAHPPTSSAPAELPQQIDAVRRALERYRDHAHAVADGYVMFGEEGPLTGEHWYRKDLVLEPFQLERPSTLQYASIHGRRELVGVAYTVYRRPGEPLPEGFAGSSDVWHVHDVTRIGRALTQDQPLLRWLVNRRIQNGKAGGGDGKTELTMIHAWLWLDNPDGVFALQHRALPYLRAGLPADFAATGNAAAAWGISLSIDGGCAVELKRTDALAKLSSSQQKELKRACEIAASRMWSALAGPRSSEAINSAASDAWTEYEKAKNGLLTAEQKANMAAIVEHPMDHKE
jgi:hypothetical protein